MASKNIHVQRRGSSGGIDSLAEELGLGIKCCEVALSSASAATWDRKIKDAQRAHDIAQRFVHRFRISGHEAERINHRIVHLKTLLEELK
jgi:hypothetical protein